MTGSTNGAECKYNVKIHVLHKRLSLPFTVLARYYKTKKQTINFEKEYKSHAMLIPCKNTISCWVKRKPQTNTNCFKSMY